VVDGRGQPGLAEEAPVELGAGRLFSITSSCQRHGLDPFAYLRDVLARLPDQSPERLEELLPDRWAAVQKAATAS